MKVIVNRTIIKYKIQKVNVNGEFVHTKACVCKQDR